MSLTFPLCGEPRHEAPLRDVLAECTRLVRRKLPPRGLVALVLTGSFARGEGTVLGGRDHLRVLGDLEFLVVVDRSRSARLLRRETSAWGREARATLRDRGIRVDVEFGPCDTDYLLRHARPSIFVYDLAQHGKVIAGDPAILRLLAPFAPESIPREDAVFLLFNRTIEQLEAHDRIAAAGPYGLLGIAYDRVKLILDLAGSALAFAGAHTPSYVERPSAFARLVAETPSLGALLPASFERELEAAAVTKVAPVAAALLPAGTAAEQQEWLREHLLEAAAPLAAVLRWELEQYLGHSGELADLVDRFTQCTSRRRLREWAKLALHPLPAPLPLSLVRAARLGARATPRGLLYAAGMLAYLDLAAGRTDPGTVARRLPLRRRALPLEPAQQRRAVTALWRWCVRNN